MSAHIIGACFMLDLSTSEKIVLMALADCSNDDGVSIPGRSYLAQKTSLSVRSISGIIAKLIGEDGNGYITVVQRRTVKGDLTSNSYTLNVERILSEAMAARKKNRNPVAEKSRGGSAIVAGGVVQPLPYPSATIALPCLSPELSPKPSPPKKPAAISRHGWFSRWWCHAYQQTTGERYAFSKKAAGMIANLLKQLELDDLIGRSCVYLSLHPADRFPRGQPTLEGLATMINRLAGKYDQELDDRFVAAGLLPPADVKLADFQPWGQHERKTTAAA